MTPADFLVWAALFPEALFLVTVSGTILAGNEPAGDLVGRSRPALVGATIFDLVTTPPAQVKAYLQACARTRTMLLGALMFRDRHGEEQAYRMEGAALHPRTAEAPAVLLLRCRPKLQTVQPFIQLNERLLSLRSMHRHLQEAYTRLQEQHEWFVQTLTSIGDAVIATDIQGRVTLMNTTAEALTGWTAQEAQGRAITDVFHIVQSTTRQTVESPVMHALREGTVVGLANHTLLVARDGTARPIDDSGAPIYTADGRFLGVVLVFRDVTARVQAEQAIQQAQVELERRIEERTAALQQEMAERQRLEHEAQQAQHFTLLGRLAAGVSHELRNPLAAAFLHVELLDEELQQPFPNSAIQTTEIVKELRLQLGRVDDLLQDYLSLVRVAAIERTQQDLGAAMQTWIAEWQALATTNGITLQEDGLAELGEVAFHPGTLRRALLNLVQNAVEAMPTGGNLLLTGQRTATQVQITVCDTGSGISAEKVSKVFEPLYTSKPGGTGLGLYLVHKILTAHEGHITVESVPEQGTTFTVTLPHRASASTRLR